MKATIFVDLIIWACLNNPKYGKYSQCLEEPLFTLPSTKPTIGDLIAKMPGKFRFGMNNFLKEINFTPKDHLYKGQKDIYSVTQMEKQIRSTPFWGPFVKGNAFKIY